MLVLGALGVEEEQMAHGSLLAIGGGLVLALPTALTGLVDWLDIPKATPARTTAIVHLLVMLDATAGLDPRQETTSSAAARATTSSAAAATA